MVENLIFSGGIFHDFADSSQTLSDIMAPLGVRSQIVTDIEQGVAALATGQYRMLTVNALRWQMLGEKYDAYREQWGFTLSAEARGALASFVSRGNCLLGIHTASICFDDWAEWREILGGVWRWGVSHHPPVGPVEAVPVETTPMETIATGRDAIIDGCQSFSVNDEAYSAMDLLPTIEPLLISGQPSSGQPLLWKHQYGDGRVVYDALGHDSASLEEPTHKRILQRAVAWLLEGKANNEK